MPVLRSWTVDTGSGHVPLLEGVVVLGRVLAVDTKR